MADRATAPIDMLRKCRSRFTDIRDWERSQHLRAKTDAARSGASVRAKLADEFVTAIDATLRDWA